MRAAQHSFPDGDNRYHAILGNDGRLSRQSVEPGPALIALYGQK
jgi:hypothetical protein